MLVTHQVPVEQHLQDQTVEFYQGEFLFSTEGEENS